METPTKKSALRSSNDEDPIQHWLEQTSFEPEHQGQGVISRLCLSCENTLQCFIQHLDPTSISRSDRNVLRRSLASLRLWSDGHGATTGALDTTLDRSKNLRLTTLSILNPMCGILSQGLRKHILSRTDDETIVLLCSAATELHDGTNRLLADYDDDTNGSDSDSSGSSDDGGATDKMHELVWSIKTYTNSLLDLSVALNCPALEPEVDSLVMPGQRSAHDYHTDLIKAKFPDAGDSLLQVLGQTSWDRYQRMQQERDSNARTQAIAYACGKSQAADSEFQDSGLGASLPPATHTYAQTVASSMSSLSGGNRATIPPLPDEAKNGKPFECNACGKLIRAFNSRDWRKHLYMDLRPYNCLFIGCSFSREPFTTRKLWTEHLELDHGFGPAWDAVQCPLCLDTTNSGKNAVLLHFARHMEEIALTSLPRDIETNAESSSVAETEGYLGSADAGEQDTDQIKCCDSQKFDGGLVLCEACNTWQHIQCYYESAENVPDVHKCQDCRLRSVDMGKATQEQVSHPGLLRGLTGMASGNQASLSNAVPSWVPRFGREETFPNNGDAAASVGRQLDSLENASVQNGDFNFHPSTANPAVDQVAKFESAYSQVYYPDWPPLPESTPVPGIEVYKGSHKRYHGLPTVLDPHGERTSRDKKGLAFHECSSCGRSYTRKDKLRRHQMKHSLDEQPCRGKILHRLNLLQRPEEEHYIELDGNPHRSRAPAPVTSITKHSSFAKPPSSRVGGPASSTLCSPNGTSMGHHGEYDPHHALETHSITSRDGLSTSGNLDFEKHNEPAEVVTDAGAGKNFPSTEPN